MLYHITLKSANAKTGPIPVTTTSNDSCPKSCGQYDACYAKSGPLALHWRKNVSKSLDTLTSAIKAFPAGQLWRHNQAGDLPGTDGRIDAKALRAIVDANKGRKGFTYTHKPLIPANARAIKQANANGFTVNISADTLSQVDTAKRANVGPVVVVLPHDVDRKQAITTRDGHKVIICPADTHGVSCVDCKLCAWKDRDVVIGFPAHGAKKRSVKSDLVRIGA